LLNKYGSKGLELIAVPSNQFGEQAPHSSACERAYMYRKMNMQEQDFPILDKVHVNGEKTVPFYRFLKGQHPKAEGGVLPPIALFRGDIPAGDLSWNYEKFFVDENGKVIKRISHAKEVQSPDVEEFIIKHLGL